LFFTTEILKKLAATPVKSRRNAPVMVIFALIFIDFEGRLLLEAIPLSFLLLWQILMMINAIHMEYVLNVA
jgi:hypothetical protein